MTQAATGAGEVVSCYRRGDVDIWAIYQPNVRARETSYPGIRFQQGDLVSVMAGGCVQTGGSGQTWKRYVNPITLAKNDDSKYYGLIAIPGALSARRIREAIQASPIAMLTDPGPDGFLRLGYTDDGYGDNGYWGPDWGLWEQCRQMPKAFVVIAIQHNCATSGNPACVRLAPLDLVDGPRDANGFLLNPLWAWQALTGTITPAWQVCGLNFKSGGMPEDDLRLCARQLIEKDTYWACARGGTWGRIQGHANWPDTPVTYEGTLTWDDHSDGDDDYTLNLTNVSGALSVYGGNLQVEFDSDETIDGFTSSWWTKFRASVDAEDDIQANPLGPQNRPAAIYLREKFAIVTGLLGLDCVHICNSELHPVWALAVHTTVARDDDVWAFFVRNWGNEGFCGRSNHTLPVRTITLRLPRAGATGVTLLPTTQIGANGAIAPYTVAMAPEGGAALVTFTLPDPSDQRVIHGDLHLKWDVPLGARLGSERVLRRTPSSQWKRLSTSAEMAAATSMARLTPAQKAVVRGARRKVMAGMVVPVVGQQVTAPPTQRPPANVRTIPVPAPAHDTIEEARAAAIRSILRRRVPPP